MAVVAIILGEVAWGILKPIRCLQFWWLTRQDREMSWQIVTFRKTCWFLLHWYFRPFPDWCLLIPWCPIFPHLLYRDGLGTGQFSFCLLPGSFPRWSVLHGGSPILTGATAGAGGPDDLILLVSLHNHPHSDRFTSHLHIFFPDLISCD